MKLLKTLLIVLAISALPFSAHAQLTIPQGGTGQTRFATNSIPFMGTSTLRFSTSSSFVWDATNNRLGVGTSTPTSTLQVLSTTEQFRSGYNPSIYWNAATDSSGRNVFTATGGLQIFRFASSVGVGVVPTYTLDVAAQVAVPQFRVAFTTTDYWSTRVVNGGETRFDFRGTTPITTFTYNGVQNFQFGDGGQFYINGAYPYLSMSGNAGGGFMTAGGVSDAFGIYSNNGDEAIAAYDPNLDDYQYFNGQVHGNTGLFHVEPNAEFANEVKIMYSPSKYVTMLTQSSGNIIFDSVGTSPGFLFSDGTQVNGLFEVYKTSNQARIGYDGSNRLDLTVGATGAVAFDALGTGANFSFADKLGIGSTTPSYQLSVTGIAGSALTPIFSVASSTNSNRFSVNGAGHIVTGGSAPTVSSCGTSPSISGNDTAGTVTVGTGVVVACTITFSTARANTPRVVGVVTGGGLNIAGGYSAKSTSAVTFSFAATVGGGTFDYMIIE